MAREFAQVVRKWADDMESQPVAPEHVAAQRARRCMWYMYAIMCHSWGQAPNAAAKSSKSPVFVLWCTSSMGCSSNMVKFCQVVVCV